MAKRFFNVNSRDSQATLYDFVSIRVYSWLESSLGYAWLAGIGFTMSLFIAMLAFSKAALVDAAKLGVLADSLLAGVIAMTILKTIGQGKI
jgi:Na+/H+ antiporter NhaA